MSKSNNIKRALFIAFFSVVALTSIVGFLTQNSEAPEELAVGGGPGTINQISPFIVTGGYVKVASSTAGLQVPSLANCDTIDTNGDGKFECGTDGGGGGSATTTINGVSGPTFTFATGTATGIGLTISTSSGTLTFTPTVSSGYNIPLSASTTNWETAYGWGDHSLAGYLTSFTELDPVFSASDAFGISSGDISSWDAAAASTTALTPAYIRGLFSNTATGLTYNSSTGATSLTANYVIPLTASTTEWHNFHTTPSGRITAGTGIDWTGNTLDVTVVDTNTTYTAGDALTLTGTDFDFDGGATPSGDLGGTWASPSVTDDSHAHTGASLSGIDISSDTNLSGDSEIVLTGDALSIASTIARDSELHNAVTLVGQDFLSLSTQQITANPINEDNLNLNAPTDNYLLVASSTALGGFEWVATSTARLGLSSGGGSGTVTSVDMTVPTGLAISGNPVTTSGTLALSLAAGYNIPLSASTTNWNGFYDVPSTRITAGTGIDWSGNTLNGVYTAGDGLTLTGEDFDFDGGASPGGSLGGTWASPTIDDLFVLNTSDTMSGSLGIGTTLSVTGISTLATTTITGDFAVNTNDLLVDESTGYVGIGTTTPLYPLHLETTVTTTTGNPHGSLTSMFLDPTGNSSATVIGTRDEIQTASDNASNYATLLANAPRIFHNGTGLVSDMRGNNLVASNRSTGSVTLATGGYFALSNTGGGTITNARAGYFNTNNSSGTVTNGYGLYADYTNGTTATTTNTYGVYIGDVTSGVQTNQAYGLYQTDTAASNYFGGNTGIGTSTPSAKLQVDGSSSGTILSLFSNAGTKFMEMLNTGVTTLLGSWDFGGADFLEIPNGTGPTANDPGEIAHDTSGDQLIVDDFVMASGVQKIWSVTVASTSPAFLNAGLLKVPTELDGYTITAIRCSVQSGTSKIIAVEDESGNSSEDITCATTVTSDDGTITNATATAAEEMYIDFGATSGAVDYVSVSVFGTWTRE